LLTGAGNAQVLENTTAGVDHRRPGAFRRLLLYPPELRARVGHRQHNML